MKLPKTFRPKKDLEEKTKQLVESAKLKQEEEPIEELKFIKDDIPDFYITDKKMLESFLEIIKLTRLPGNIEFKHTSNTESLKLYDADVVENVAKQMENYTLKK